MRSLGPRGGMSDNPLPSHGVTGYMAIQGDEPMVYMRQSLGGSCIDALWIVVGGP